jgi:hypothetical protein
MNKRQATTIQRLLFEIDDALHRAGAAIFKLDEEDRQMFIEPLWDLEHCLHSKMLDLVHAQYPELGPPHELPSISTSLLWKNVKLPKSVSEADLDTIIFSILTSRQQKTAMVVGRAVNHCEKHNLPVGAAIFGARIKALAKSGRIEAFGDLRLWGRSEVKLKD